MEKMLIIQLCEKFKINFYAFSALSQITHTSCFAMETSVFLSIIKTTLKLLQKLLLNTDYKQMFMCIFQCYTLRLKLQPLEL